MNPGLVLYRFFDADGRLLYVGKSVKVWQRFADHQRGSRFFDLAVSITLQRGFRSEAELLDAEAAAISAERPLFNKNLLAGRPVKLVPPGDVCRAGACVGLAVCRSALCHCCERDLVDAQILESAERVGVVAAAAESGLQVDQIETTCARLTEMVRRRFADGATVSDVVAQLGVSVDLACRVGRGESATDGRVANA